ncbi:MAG: cobalt ECF transporter T component CbiQ [Dictyoglomaceae bacterium]|nr:cobalt ECF transporter T component CbiQ [Dictyoglomaceae bacterium]
MSNFIDKTLNDFNKVLKSTFLEEKRDSLLYNVNEKIKIILLFFTLVIISFLNKIESILLFYSLSIFLGYLGKISLRKLLKRTWIFIPFFTFIIVLPSIFINPLDFTFGFTLDGAITALKFVLRVATSISYIQLLILSTPWIDLFSGLRGLGVPSLIITILVITYRYIFLLLKIAEELYLAKKSRTITFNIKREQNFTANTIAIMIIKSHELAKEVSQGMLSRGINKDFSFHFGKKISFMDILILVSMLFTFLVILFIVEGVRI